jgi:hypothetical protein
MDIHGSAGGTIDAVPERQGRDGIIWSHLAGDTVQRMKVARRILAG